MGWAVPLLALQLGKAASSSAAAAVPRVGPRGGPLDSREITFFFDTLEKSVILLVYISQKSKTSKF